MDRESGGNQHYKKAKLEQKCEKWTLSRTKHKRDKEKDRLC
jgi:hypothetical protein